MKLAKRGEKGFTLIELLIVVAILGVLAAVVIPNVGKFIGRGKTEAASTELANIQSAVVSMMVDTSVQSLGTNITALSTNDMNLFPDKDAAGSTLFNWATTTTTNYVQTQNTTKFYTVDATGTVLQHSAAGHAHSDGGETP